MIKMAKYEGIKVCVNRALEPDEEHNLKQVLQEIKRLYPNKPVIQQFMAKAAYSTLTTPSSHWSDLCYRNAYLYSTANDSERKNAVLLQIRAIILTIAQIVQQRYNTETYSDLVNTIVEAVSSVEHVSSYFPMELIEKALSGTKFVK